MRLIIGTTLAMTAAIVSAWGCFNWLKESAYVCVALILPSLPFTFIADALELKYDFPTNWPLLIVGTFFSWLAILGIVRLLPCLYHRSWWNARGRRRMPHDRRSL